MMPHVGWLLHGRQTEHGLEITGQPLQPFGQQTFTCQAGLCSWHWGYRVKGTDLNLRPCGVYIGGRKRGDGR